MGTSPRLVLVGPPGSGKTTIGRLVAERLGVRFRDTDTDIEEGTGESVADIFVVHGEARFRELERDAVRAGLAEHDGVLALGGGAVTDEGTREALAGHRVVFLDVGLADAVRRVGLARDRPVLLGNPRATLHRLMATRRPLYEQVATVTVDTDGRAPEDIADEVVAALGAQSGERR